MGKVLGLDIGIASVGWGLIDTDNKEIIDMGVRLFDSADASNNKKRREARSAKRNLRRKKYRLKSVKNLLNEYGFEDNHLNQNPYELRVKALDEKLSEEELYAALCHLVKRRGVSYLDGVENININKNNGNEKNNDNKKDKNDSNKKVSDKKKYKESLEQNKKLLENKYPCQIQLERFKKHEQVRGIIEPEDEEEILMNIFTTGAYKNEAIAILGNQSKYHEKIDKKFIEAYVDILTRKRKFYVGPGDKFNRTNYGIYKTDGTEIKSIFEELIGKCSVYEEERRAPGTSFTAQEFNVLNDLNNLVVEGRKLDKEEKQRIVATVLDPNKTMLIIIKEIADLQDVDNIKGYRIDKKGNPEFHTFEAERKLSLALKGTGVKYENFNIDKKDKLAEILNLSMDYDSLVENCKEFFPEFSDVEIDLLFNYLQKNKRLYKTNPWHSFSLKVMKEMRERLYEKPENQMNILTEMGINKSISNKLEKYKGYKYIPMNFLSNDIYNPVVRRSVNQSIGIVNAIFKKYGELEAIIIEMPRETNSKEEKKKIEEIQKFNRTEKKKAIKKFQEEYNVAKNEIDKDLSTKIRLWYQQDGRCIYTGNKISAQDLINNPKMFEVDHIIPKSISLDDGLNNKVLVYYEVNRIKGQKTPFHAFSISSEVSYDAIKNRASDLLKGQKINKTKFNLLTFEEDINRYEVRQKFINRNLVDTRYASKVVLNGLQSFIKLQKNKTQIHVIRGKFTSQVRRRWGIHKDRKVSFEHHGIDAVIVAVSYMLGQSEGTVRNPFLQKIEKKDKSYWEIKENKEYDREVYKFPWSGFKNDLNKATEAIKYSHKIDTKVNRQISDLNPCSTRKIDGVDYVVKKYKNIYDNKVAKLVIKKIRDDLSEFQDPNNSMILMRRHDPRTFNELVKIIDKYEGEKPNPFAVYKKEHGPIRKYSKKEGKGPIIKGIKYLDKKLGEHIELKKTENLSNDKKVVLLKLKHFRTDVYFNEKKGVYKNIGIKYNDLIFKDGKYLINIEGYSETKEKLGIDKNFKFLFSLHKNDIIGIVYKNNPNKEERYRFLSCKSDNYNRIEVKPIEKSKFDKREHPTIGTKVLKFNKYYTDILGNVYNIQGETIKLEFTRVSPKFKYQIAVG